MTSQVEQQVKPLNVKEIVSLLNELFPSCFSLTGEVKPLKIGIFQDLVERLATNPLLSKTQLRQALRVYTSSWRYLAAVKEGVARIDLDGVSGELVDAKQAEHAAQTLADSKAKATEVRKARNQAQKKQNQAEATEQATGSDATATPVKAPVAKKKFDRKFPAKAAATSTPKPTKAVKVAKSESAVVAELTPVDVVNLHVGAKVLVKLGLNPMPATIVEVNKQDVVIQLMSGMVVKTQLGSLYQA